MGFDLLHAAVPCNLRKLRLQTKLGWLCHNRGAIIIFLMMHFYWGESRGQARGNCSGRGCLIAEKSGPVEMQWRCLWRNMLVVSFVSRLGINPTWFSLDLKKKVPCIFLSLRLRCIWWKGICFWSLQGEKFRDVLVYAMRRAISEFPALCCAFISPAISSFSGFSHTCI